MSFRNGPFAGPFSGTALEEGNRIFQLRALETPFGKEGVVLLFRG